MNEVVAGHRAMKRVLIEKSLEDEAFRQRLLAEPKATVEQELGRKLPADLEVRVIEETPNTLYMVLPPTRAPGELSEQELNAVAGGGERDERPTHDEFGRPIAPGIINQWG